MAGRALPGPGLEWVMQDRVTRTDYHAPFGPLVRRWRGAGKVAVARFAVQRFGFGGRCARMSVWFHGASDAQFDAVAGLVRDVMGGRGDLALVVTAPDAAAVEALRRRFPDDLALAAPCARAGSIGRFLARVRPCALVLLDDGRGLDPATLARLRASPLPIVAMGDGAGAAAAIGALSASLRDLPPTVPAGALVGPAWQVPTLRDRVGQSRPWKAVAPLLMLRRIDGWERLRERLSRPRCVLCLGNGPSSEDPRLATVRYDCLIRVNWRWRERGFLVRPDIVFVGDAATIHKVPPCIFGLWSVKLEHAMLLRHLVTHGPIAMEYFTVERFSPLAAEQRWPVRPSNGALAIVSAAALAPERLIIGGMDLFRHADGRYPGEGRSRNEYSTAHKLETELALIDLALRDFRGELVILSAILRDHLERYRESTRRAG
jgi:hypothetical protein